MRPPVRALLGAFLSLAVAAVAAPSAASASSSAPSTAARRVAPIPHALGAIPPSVRVEASSAVKARSRTPLALPTSADLSANAPAIGDQGQLGSCATWAIGYGILGYYSKTQPHAGAPFAPLSVYNLVNGGGDNGSRSSDIYAVLQSRGIIERAVWTHSDGDYRSQPTSAEAADALKHRTSGGSYLFAGQNQGTAAMIAIETALAAGKPVAIGIPVYLPFEYLNANESVMTAAKATGTMLGGHMIAAYGYDQTGVKIANSWGIGWGRAGWATLSWDFVDRYAFEASTPGAFTASNPSPAPVQPAPAVTDVSPRTAVTTGGTVVTVKGTGFATSSSKASKPSKSTKPAKPAKPAKPGKPGKTVRDARLQVAVVSAADPTRSYPATVRAASGTQLSVSLPAVPSNGAYRVVVTTSGGSSDDTTADDVSYVQPPAISVAAGAKVPAGKGGVVLVLGSGFGATNADVAAGRVTAAVNGSRVNAVWVSDGVLAVPVPGGTPGQFASIVVTEQGFASAPVRVPYVASISALAPAFGPSSGGTVVTVTGRGLGGASTWALTAADGSLLAQLPVVSSLDQVPAGVLVVSDSQVRIKMPPAPAPFLPVVVTFTPDQRTYPGTSSAPTAGSVFTYSDLG